MAIRCIWEHNGLDSLLYAADYPGAFTRGASLEEALLKMPAEIQRYSRWLEMPVSPTADCLVIQEKSSSLMIRDADSDVLFDTELEPLTLEEYTQLKTIVLKSARDFYALYLAIPEPHQSCLKKRQTFYRSFPCTAQEMYDHTRSVNTYYFGEIGINADSSGRIDECREQGFATLEQQPFFLRNDLHTGSYDEQWTVRKMLRRFIWHDRIHARAMWRMACRTFGAPPSANPFHFE